MRGRAINNKRHVMEIRQDISYEVRLILTLHSQQPVPVKLRIRRSHAVVAAVHLALNLRWEDKRSISGPCS